MDKSRCRVTAHDRSLHAECAAVHPKAGRVTWLNHKTKTGGSAGGDGIRARREASMLAGTWRDHRACVGRTQTAAKAWPCDEEKCYMSYLPLRDLYLKLCNRGSFVFRMSPYILRGVMMVKTRLTLRLDSQAYKPPMPFFTYGRHQGLSIHGARGLLALNHALIGEPLKRG
jgi:hypothetical protein